MPSCDHHFLVLQFYKPGQSPESGIKLRQNLPTNEYTQSHHSYFDISKLNEFLDPPNMASVFGIKPLSASNS